MHVMGRIDDYPRLKKYREQLNVESYTPVSEAGAACLRDQFQKAFCLNDSEGVVVNGESFALIDLLIEARVPVAILDRYIDIHDRELQQNATGREDTP